MSSGAAQPQRQAQPAPPASAHDLQPELQATLHGRRELGAEYEPVLIEHFLERLDRTIDARIEAKVGSRRGSAPAPQPAFTKEMVGGLAVTLGAGIPITAIAGGIGDTEGIVAVWFSIAVIWLGILGYLPRPKQ